MKNKAKKAICVLLSVLMAFSFSLFALAAEETGGVTYLKRTWDFENNTVTETEETLTETARRFPEEIADGGWFVIDGDKTVEDRVTVPAGSTVNLLLVNGATLTCGKGIGVQAGATLNIYGQTSDEGKLIATGSEYNAGIAGDDETGHGAVNIYGGTVEATGGEYAAGIGTGDQTDGSCALIAIYGGIVSATGGYKGAGIGGGNESRGGSIRICGGEHRRRYLYRRNGCDHPCRDRHGPQLRRARMDLERRPQQRNGRVYLQQVRRHGGIDRYCADKNGDLPRHSNSGPGGKVHGCGRLQR